VYARVSGGRDVSVLTTQCQRGVVDVEAHLLQVPGLVQQFDHLPVEVHHVATVVAVPRQQRRMQTGAGRLHRSVPTAVIQHLAAHHAHTTTLVSLSDTQIGICDGDQSSGLSNSAVHFIALTGIIWLRRYL